MPRLKGSKDLKKRKSNNLACFISPIRINKEDLQILKKWAKKEKKEFATIIRDTLIDRAKNTLDNT